MVYAIGGGLLEVLVSPVVEACPSANKEKAMSMLHSFYCWGQAGIVLLSTLFFQIAGDLAGPMAFALLMGAARLFYGKYGHRIHLERFMTASSCLCIASYLGISLFSLPQLSLAACALCGLSVGILWPGTFSRASAALPKGGTALFALLALGGDIGCAGGPTVVGMVSDAAGGNLKMGILAGIIFPVLLLAGNIICRK